MWRQSGRPLPSLSLIIIIELLNLNHFSSKSSSSEFIHVTNSWRDEWAGAKYVIALLRTQLNTTFRSNRRKFLKSRIFNFLKFEVRKLFQAFGNCRFLNFFRAEADTDHVLPSLTNWSLCAYQLYNRMSIVYTVQCILHLNFTW